MLVLSTDTFDLLDSAVLTSDTLPTREATHSMLSPPTTPPSSRLEFLPISRITDRKVAINTRKPGQHIGLIPGSSATSIMPPQTGTSPPNMSISGFGFLGPTSNSGRSYHIPTSFVKQPSIHAWELPICYKIPDNPIEKILYGVIQTQRERAKEGLSNTALAGPRRPSASMLAAPDRFNPLEIHPVARTLGEMLSKITYRTFIDKLGALIVMYPVYQWQITLTYEAYANIPSWCLPLLCQRMTPHPVWICALGCPGLREMCVADQERYCTEEFQYLLVASLNMNWPHGIEEALVWDGKDIKFRDEFWEHARVLDNWTVDEPFQSRYPELEPYCTFTKYPEKKARRK